MARWTPNWKHRKDPSDVIDYTLDFTGLLQADSIGSITVTGQHVSIDTSSFDGNIVTVWVSGGSCGTTGSVTVKLVTTNTIPRTIERSFKIDVVNL